MNPGTYYFNVDFTFKKDVPVPVSVSMATLWNFLMIKNKQSYRSTDIACSPRTTILSYDVAFSIKQREANAALDEIYSAYKFCSIDNIMVGKLSNRHEMKQMSQMDFTDSLPVNVVEDAFVTFDNVSYKDSGTTYYETDFFSPADRQSLHQKVSITAEQSLSHVLSKVLTFVYEKRHKSLCASNNYHPFCLDKMKLDEDPAKIGEQELIKFSFKQNR